MGWEQGYREWAPPAGLDGSVACLWTSVVPPGGRATLVLPDACCDLIWESGRGVFVAGPDTGPWPSAPPAGTVFAGVRLLPGAGGPALGLPLSAVLDRRVEAADLGTGLGARLARQLAPSLAPEVALRLLAAAAADEIQQCPADPLVTEAARLLARPGTQAGDVASRLGVGERQLLRRCRAAVGYGPATLRRVLRFRRFLSRLDAGEAGQAGTRGSAALRGAGELVRPGVPGGSGGPGRPGGPGGAGEPVGPGGPGLAWLAAETGYADQAHLTRECVRLAGLPPAALAAQRWPAAA
jgi:AraC-like DNA-binding protein